MAEIGVSVVDIVIPEWLTSGSPGGDKLPRWLAAPNFEPVSTVYIYGLYDPRDGRLRYIGKTIHPRTRLAAHCNENGNFHRGMWIKELRSLGLKPTMEILEEIRGNWPWQESEVFWIARMRSEGADLTNNTTGGDGAHGLHPDAVAKMRATWMGRTHSPESRLKISAAKRGVTYSQEVKDKVRRAMTGRIITWGDKMSAASRKLTVDQQGEILKRFQDGERSDLLAIEYGVARTTIEKVKRGTYTRRYRTQHDAGN